MLRIVKLNEKGQMRIKYGTGTLTQLFGSNCHYLVFSPLSGDSNNLLEAEGKTPELALGAFEEWLRRNYPELLDQVPPDC